MIVSLIVAMDEMRGIGKQNRLPWHLPSDLKRFKRLTMGHYVVMGRKTYETIGKPLPGRTTIVITHQEDYHASGCLVVRSLSEALKIADDQHESEIFVIGGGEIFRQTIDLADKIYLTNVHTSADADIFFPTIGAEQWKRIKSEAAFNEERDEYPSDFAVLLRIGKSHNHR